MLRTHPLFPLSLLLVALVHVTVAHDFDDDLDDETLVNGYWHAHHDRMPFLTSETGHRVGTNQHSQSMTPEGPLLLQYIYALEKLRRFNTERIPERVVHARGVLATGYFEASTSLSKYTRSAIFSMPRKRTEVAVRFSTVIGGRDSAETARDPRGFAIKFKSVEDGNWDLVGNNLPVFFIRDHVKFPDMVHSLKPDPVTNLPDPNRFFDFFAALGGMATNTLTHLYSDQGIPKNYRFIQGNSVHAYKFVNSAGKVTYVKLRWFPDGGVQNLTRAQAAKIQGMDTSHATRDLVSAIRMGNFPAWTMKIQTMDIDELDKQEFNPLDATKAWPEDKFPLMTVGRLVLNAIPDNFFTGSEQSAFDPGNFPPGRIEPSEDKLLQGRLISYHESQTYRHRSNVFQRLKINRPRAPLRNYNQDGVMNPGNAWKGSINYEPSLKTSGVPGRRYREDPSFLMSQRAFCGNTVQQSISKTLNFKQAGEVYRAFSQTDKTNLIGNIAADLSQVKSKRVKNTIAAHFYKADRSYGARVCKAVMCQPREMRMIASKLQE